MATTHESYKTVGRIPRYSTKLSAFASGMYLTNQIIPEGYAKLMVNYDIDDTGSFIRPKAGRKLVQELNLDYPSNGPVTLTDYIYSYNDAEDEVAATKDIVMSLGKFTQLKDLVGQTDVNYGKHVFLSHIKEERDNNVYAYDDAEDEWVVQEQGTKETIITEDFWALAYDKDAEEFKKIKNTDIGYVAARTINNAYAFNKPFVGPVGRPVYAVVNNEIYTLAGNKVTHINYPANYDRNELVNFNKPELCKLILKDNNIKRKRIEPKKLNPLEAAATGYNILASNPYSFENEQSGTTTILGVVAYKDKECTEVQLSPRIGETVYFHIVYTYASKSDKLKCKVESLDLTRNNSDFDTLEDFTLEVTNGNNLVYAFTPTVVGTQLRFTIRKEDDTTTQYPFVYPLVIGDDSIALEAKRFDLTTGKGMVSWRNCLGIYGVNNAANTIFFSDVEDPSYFPYPYNAISFDNDILAVHNYLDYLLVVTVDSIWLVKPDSVIMTSEQKRILTNIHIPEIDAINLVVLKDQIFFKTDSEFYVLKPNNYTSDATDLKNYVNSIAIANYIDKFQEETVKLFNKLYKDTLEHLSDLNDKAFKFADFNIYDAFSIVKNSEVHYIYTIEPLIDFGQGLGNAGKLNLHFVYNTISRSWRLYLCNTGLQHKPVLYKNKQSGEFYEFFPVGNRMLVSKESYDVVSDRLDEKIGFGIKYDNYQYLDTGNVAIDDVFTKRFREVQFNLVNMEHTAIPFYIDFKLDGLEKINATRYEITHITDKDDPEYGVIRVIPIEASNMSLPGLTSMAESITESDHFALDLSHFPDLDVATVRFELQGRGRRGSLQILNTSLKRYTLSDVTWVYRMMSAR